MSEWTVEITRGNYSFTDERWHWKIYEDGHVPMDNVYFSGWAITKKRAMRKAEKTIEQIVQGRCRKAESISYQYSPVGDAREA